MDLQYHILSEKATVARVQVPDGNSRKAVPEKERARSFARPRPMSSEQHIHHAYGRLNSCSAGASEHAGKAGGELPDVQEELSPMDLFSQFYEAQNGMTMSEEQTAVVTDLIDEIWEVDR